MVVTFLKLIVGQTTVFTTKQQRHIMGLGFLPNSRAALSRVNQWPGNSALPGTGAHYQATAGNSLIHRINYSGIGQHISCASRTPHSSGSRIL